MTRTTIVLPPRLKEKVAAQARGQGISFGEFVRRTLERTIKQASTQRTGRDPFLSDNAVFRGKAPGDLSRRHDSYLYGQK